MNFCYYTKLKIASARVGSIFNTDVWRGLKFETTKCKTIGISEFQNRKYLNNKTLDYRFFFIYSHTQDIDPNNVGNVCF